MAARKRCQWCQEEFLVDGVKWWDNFCCESCRKEWIENHD